MLLWRILMLVFVPIHFVTAKIRGASHPPTKPEFTYISPGFSVKHQGKCLDGTRVWIYTPDVPKSNAPDVIVYLHGYGATTPMAYEGHIEHLVKQGNFVVYPQMQDGNCDLFRGKLLGWAVRLSGKPSPAKWVKVTAEVVSDALISLPPFGKVFLYGHSMGGAFAMMWEYLNPVYPVEAAVVSAPQPAGLDVIPGIYSIFFIRLGEDINVPNAAPNTTFPVAVLYGDDDKIVSFENILPSYELLGSTFKAWYQAQTDHHGRPVLSADHMQPSADQSEAKQDSLDWRFTWSALDQVIGGRAVTALEFDMGQWSDGTPVKSVVRLY